MACAAESESSSEEESCSDSECEIDGILYTPVPHGLFDTPKPTSRSGGTAAFFNARYSGPAGAQRARWGKSDTYWLAKDLARAVDELDFYENLAALGPEYRLLHRWAMEYGGVLHARCEGAKLGVLEPTPRKLMLLRNLRDGIRTLRMLDVKIGSVTAVAGWQGKSASAASRQYVVDLLTNSSAQGFRLEGFDNPPEALSTLLQGESQGCVSWLRMRPGKKAKRFQLQRLCAPEFLLYWMDFAALQPQEGPRVLRAIEYSEAALFDAIGQLAELCLDAEAMPVPQMWIGSSVAFACEGGELPERQRAQALLHARASAVQRRGVAPGGVPEQNAEAPLARISVFDWGRSELNTAKHHAGLPPAERELREKFWPIWKRGPLRLLYDAMWLYCTQFQPAPRAEVEFSVFDEDTLDASDGIGRAVAPLEPTEGPMTLPLGALSGFGSANTSASAIEVEIERSEPPAGSRLAEIWHITVHGVSNLPRMDCCSASDPRVHVTIGGAAQAFTPVVYNDNDAKFGSRLDFGIARRDVYDAMFRMVSLTAGRKIEPSMLPEPGKWEEGNERFDGFLRGSQKFAHLAETPGVNSRLSDAIGASLRGPRTVGSHVQ